MNDARPDKSGAEVGTVDIARRIHLGILWILPVLMAVELALALAEGQWLVAFQALAIMSLALGPVLLRSRLPVSVPPEFQVFAIVFVFAALYLGEIHSYYERFWWWDLVLHAGSGLLFGILGFLLVYVLNENERIDLHMRPHFVALFAFSFAMAVGVLWEIFEFGMDRLFGTTMQKPTARDPSGLTDTMWDMVVDGVGALAISLLGWWYTKRGERSFIEAWIDKFIARNPRLFRARRGGVTGIRRSRPRR